MGLHMAKRTKHAGGRPKGGSKVAKAAALALSTLVTLMESETDPRRKARLAAQVLKATAPPPVPRPHGPQPGSQKFERDAVLARREQDRKDKRDAYQDEQRALQAERAAQKNRSLPIPIVTPETTSAVQARTEGAYGARRCPPRRETVSPTAQSTPVYTPPPPPPPPPPILVPPITLGSTPCTPAEFARLKRISADIDTQIEEKERIQKAAKSAEEQRRGEVAYAEYQREANARS
jgi:hypothetical protein